MITRPSNPIEGICERHGVALAAFAWASTGDRAQALTITARVLADADRWPITEALDDARAQRRMLAREIYVQSRSSSSAHARVVGDDGLDSAPRSDAAGLVAELRRLPVRERDPMILCSLGGHTYREAADLLATTPADIADRLLAGLRRISAKRGSSSSPYRPRLPAARFCIRTVVRAALKRSRTQSRKYSQGA